MNAENDKLFLKLRDIYREGIPDQPIFNEQINGSKAFLSNFIRCWRQRTRW